MFDLLVTSDKLADFVRMHDACVVGSRDTENSWYICVILFNNWLHSVVLVMGRAMTTKGSNPWNGIGILNIPCLS